MKHMPHSKRGVISVGVWLLLSIVGCLWVWAVNGGPLFYFDSIFYVLRGVQVFQQLNLIDPANDALIQLSGSAAGMDGGAVADNAGATGAVNGSRSLVFSIILFLFALTGHIEWFLLFNAAITVGIIWIFARAILSEYGAGLGSAQLTLIMMLVCATGSLPFYVAFLMPDLLAGLFILIAAVLIAFGGKLTVWELVALFCVGSLATVTHLSHLALAGMAAVAAILFLPLQVPGKRWVAPVMLASFVVVGIAEQVTLRIAATVTQKSDVVYMPFLSARLIQDGPGMTYLDEHCPSEVIPTCALADALKLSDDPYRLTATHIVFETSPQLGSFKLMSPDDQRDVALGQFEFFFAVLFDQPLNTTVAILRNALLQATMNSVDMTLQSDRIVKEGNPFGGALGQSFDHGRLTANTDWLAYVDPVQKIIYAISFMLVLALIVWPGAVNRPTRLFLIVICLGILGNAIVCGGVSQPATRYGARVIWLLPLSATAAIAVWLKLRNQTARLSQPRSPSVPQG